ncbi:MAG TPA: DUF1990 domain-containing protein [Pilimelia sp.]|nr:DUF1990 domain-containing protein [Pilimelia sp.]
MTALTYPEAGATRDGPLPAGYSYVRYRTYLGRGTFIRAGDAVLSFRMHRATGARVTAAAPRAAPGVRLSVGLGLGPLRITAPCEVVWVVREEDRVGFAYGTLPGHPARGEESFVVRRGADGRVRFAVTAFSVPALWYTRAGGPAVVLFQHAYARLLGARLRALCAAGTR